jgi:hypothetical protein
MIRAASLFALIALAACGADGAPERPGGAIVDLSGSATIGVEGSR